LETIRRDVLNLSRAFLFKTLSPVALALPVLTSCSSPQSAFNGAGTEADSVINLFYVMLAGSVAIWLFVVGLSFYAVRTTPAGDGARIGVRLIIWGDCVFPTVVLALLLFWGLGKMPDYRRPADGPTIAVSGERFWWRVAYDVQGDPGIVKSLPPGGVIHSFWVPALAGKTDAIPGRVNRIVLEPIVEGVYFGVCAELCGDAHAQMGLRVVAVPEAEYAAHVAAQAERQPSSRDAGSRRSSRTAAAPATPYGEPRPMARSVPTSPMSPPASPSPRDFWRPPRRTSPPSSARPIM
jgi:cytochrome c oxidase subunit 2